jgi:hypothetical protein
MKRDALGKIFKIEKSLGRSDLFTIHFHYHGRPDVVKTFHHEDKDGLGALKSSLWDLHKFRLPVPLFTMKSGGILRAIAGVFAMFEDFSPTIIKWLKIDKEKPFHPGHLGWRVLSQNSTSKLMSVLKEKKLPFNPWLLFLINEKVAARLVDPSETRIRWLFPVNVRSSEEEAELESNFTSSIGLSIYRSDLMETFIAYYQRSLIASRVKASHFLAKIVASLPESWLLKMAIARGKSNMWAGSFSNLGRWSFPEKDGQESLPSAISLAPPGGTPCFPIGIGIITWQGSLSICMRLHPCIADKSDFHEELLDEFVNAMNQSLGFTIDLSNSSRKNSIT